MIGDRDANAIGTTDFDKAVDSWKRAVGSLNNLAKSNTGISTARSITVEDIEKLGTISKGPDYGKRYTMTAGTYVDEQGKKQKATRDNPVTIKHTWYETTKLQQISNLKIGNSGSIIFLASSCVMYNYGNVFYKIRTIDSRGALDSETIFIANSETSSRSKNDVYAIVYI